MMTLGMFVSVTTVLEEGEWKGRSHGKRTGCSHQPGSNTRQRSAFHCFLFCCWLYLNVSRSLFFWSARVSIEPFALDDEDMFFFLSLFLDEVFIYYFLCIHQRYFCLAGCVTNEDANKQNKLKNTIVV